MYILTINYTWGDTVMNMRVVRPTAAMCKARLKEIGAFEFLEINGWRLFDRSGAIDSVNGGAALSYDSGEFDVTDVNFY